MSIARSQATVAPKSAEPQPNRNRNPSDLQAAEGGFAAVMEAQEPPPEARRAERESPSRPDGADRADNTDRAGQADKADKVAESEDDEDDEGDPSSAKENGKVSMQDAAAALALAASYLHSPASAKPSGAPGQAGGADGKALTGVADGQPSGADSLLADGKSLPAGNAAANGARAGLAADGRPVASSLANYASVLEQLQSRLAKGGLPVDGLASQAGGIGPADPAMAAARSATGLALQNIRMDKLMNAAQAVGGDTSAAEIATLVSLPSVAGASEALKAMDRFRGESPRGGGSGGSDGAFGQHGFTPTVQFDGTAVSATVAGQTTGDAVADQVSYWVSQGVQNASLTLEGSNAERVEVKISMTGNEAHVEFRSDQAATREMLAGTAAHLKDLLGSQGVVLSGVTVGHSGAEFGGNAASQQGQAREGQAGRRGGAGIGDAAAVAAVAPAAARAAAPAGTLDLFV